MVQTFLAAMRLHKRKARGAGRGALSGTTVKWTKEEGGKPTYRRAQFNMHKKTRVEIDGTDQNGRERALSDPADGYPLRQHTWRNHSLRVGDLPRSRFRRG